MGQNKFRSQIQADSILIIKPRVIFILNLGSFFHQTQGPNFYFKSGVIFIKPYRDAFHSYKLLSLTKPR